jgi:Xaa-Pro dipeptidase
MLINRERACKVIAEQGLDALITSSPENIVYASGYGDWRIFTSPDLEVYAVIPAKGEPALVVPVVAADYIARTAAVVSRVYTYGTFNMVRDPETRLDGTEARVARIAEANRHSDAKEALTEVLVDLGVGRTIGMDERGVSPSRWCSLQTALPDKTLVEAQRVFRDIRLIKTEAEIDRLRISVRAAEDGMLAAFRGTAPGLTEADLEAKFRDAVVSRRATPGHFETSAGIRGAGGLPPIEYRFRDGDVVHVDCGARYEAYWADTGRTAVLGVPPAKLARYYEALREGLEAVLAMLRPGATGGDLFRMGMQMVRSLGIEHYERRQIGHGIGLEFYEGPFLRDHPRGSRTIPTEGMETVLEPGMVVNVEMPYYELGLGGLQVEESVVIRASGYERLTRADLGLIPAGK